MLRRHLVGYLPSTIIPAIVSVAIISVFTRLLSPHEFGLWALASNINMLVQMMMFYWLQVSIGRFLPQALEDRQAGALEPVMALGLLGSVLLSAVLYVAVLSLLPLKPDLNAVMWLALPMLLGRAIAGIANAEHRAAGRVGTYNLIECGQIVLGFGISLTLAWYWQPAADSLVLGTMGGSALVILPYLLLTLRRLFRALPAAGASSALAALRPDRQMMRQFLAYGLPLTINNALSYIIATSDRLLIEHYLDSAAVGIYAVACGLVERSLSLVFVAVTLAAFPLAVKAFDSEGRRGAERQMKETGGTLMLVAVPTMVGIFIASQQIAATLIGEEFRAMAITIIPWMAMVAVLNGINLHYFSHAFLLTGQTARLVWFQLPAAATNIGLNILLLPRMGLAGAIWASALSYALGLGLCIVVGRRHLTVPLPLKDGALALVACLPLVVFSQLVAVPPTPAGLAILVAGGAISYPPLVWLLNVGGVRATLLRRRQRKAAAASAESTAQETASSPQGHSDQRHSNHPPGDQRKETSP